MAFIGNTNTTQAFTPAIDYFSGNGSTTAFTLSRPVASVAQVQVVVNNVAQNPSSAYTVSGNTITFTSAPLSGTNNIYVYYTSPITQVATLTQNPVITGNLNFGSTGARITGDFSNATLTNRVSFQSSTTNGATVVQLIPNGTSTSSQFSAYGGSDILNTSVAQLTNNGTEVRIASGIFGTGTYLPMTFYTGGSERMRVDSSGNVGIGTSSPAFKLEVVGATNNGIHIKDAASATVYGGLFTQAASLALYARSNHALNFGTNDTERMRIDSSGNLLVGNSTASQTMDGLFVRGKVTPTGNQWNFLTYTQNGNFTLGCRDDYYLRSPAVYDRTAGGAANVYVDSSGYLYRSTSSIRYKRDVVNYDKGLEAVSALRPVYYKSNVESPDGAVRDEQYAGFIAEEVSAAGLEEFVVRNNQGQPDALHYGNMVSLLTKAIQEQQALITALTARIEALENK